MKTKIMSVLAVCLLFFFACISVCSDDSATIKREKPVVPSMIMTPEIPDQIDFCGQSIDLKR